MGALPVALIMALVSALRWLLSWFSAEARLARLEVTLAERKGREAVEAERLRATYDRIEREKPRTPEETLRELQKRFKSSDQSKG